MDVVVWLRGLGLGKYEASFRENEIDETVLPSLTHENLKELGVTALGHRLKLLDAIAALGADTSAKAAARDATIASAQRVASEERAERRQLTVMFSDLVGSTALSARMDPEDLREVISAYQKCVSEVVRRFGGFVAQYLGDGVLVYFGYPEAHEDDAERAVRAGLELIAAVIALKTPVALQTRVGIATGLVVVGDLMTGSGEAHERGIVGETPNLAARLQGTAEPNTVVIAEATRRLLGNLFELKDLGARDLKGVAEPLRAWVALRASTVESRFEALHAAGLTALVGREEEIELLRRRWSRAKSGNGQVVLISGEPGIGKSRLTAALLERLAPEQHTRLRYFCSPQHTDSAFYPIIGQMERAAGLLHDDAPQQKLDKLDALLAQASTSIQDAALIAEMLSLPNDGRYPAFELTPQQRRQKTLEALTAQMETLSRQKPVLMIFEDAQWADPTSLEAFGRVVDRIRTLKVLLLVTFRPEFDAPWIGRPYVTTLTINRMAEHEASAMIDRVVGDSQLSASIRQDIIERTDGIPLFVEEMTKAVLEAGSETAAARAIAAVPSPTLAVPASLYASLMARLDRLGGPAKELAQIAAVIGREFSHALLASVVRQPETELNSALDRLIAAGLLFRRALPPHATYLFKHALVQDAAYGTLLRETRRQLHGRIAKALENHFPGTVETQPELIAHHCAQAGLNSKAIEYLGMAGRRAIERSSNPEAIGHLKRALEMLHSLPADSEHAQVALKLEVMLAQAMIASKGYSSPETMEVLLRAKKLITEATETSQRFTILYGMWACYYVGGEVNKQHVAATEFLSEAETHDDTAALCLAHRVLGTTYFTMGEFSAARKHLERAQGLYDPDHHLRYRFQYGQDIGTTVMCYLSWALWHLGCVDQASQLAFKAVNRAEEISHPHSLVYTLCHARGMMDVFRRQSDDTKSYAGVVTSLCSEHAFPFWAAGGQIFGGWATINQGEVDAGVDELIRGLAAWRKTGARLWLPIFLALEAEGHFKAGRNQAALHSIEQALAFSDETGERWAVAEILRVKAHLLLTTGRGRPDEVEKLLIESLEIARRQQALCWELRTSCDLGRLWQEQGRSKEAVKLLGTIYARFTEGLETTDLHYAKALIEVLNGDSVVRAWPGSPGPSI
jgi:class 3 adenylate cyclase/predicted ATPase